MFNVNIYFIYYKLKFSIKFNKIAMSKNKTSTTKASKKTAVKKTTTAKRTTAKKTTAKKSPVVSKTTTSENKESCNYSKKTKLVIAIAAILAIGFLLLKTNENPDKNSNNEIKIDQNAPVGTVKDVEEVIAVWIQNNPELILESVVNMQKRQAEKQREEASGNITKRAKDIYNRKNDPVIAPQGYDVAVVEFFDYNCGYCKRALPTIEKLTKDDKKIKIIFKELPILGKSSEDLAKVSLAFNMLAPSKYFAFHQSLMKSKAKTTAEAIAIANSHGVTKAKIDKVLSKYASKIQDEINFNKELSASIGINGTPAFLVGETLYPGAVNVEIIKNEIIKLRKKK